MRIFLVYIFTLLSVSLLAQTLYGPDSSAIITSGTYSYDADAKNCLVVYDILFDDIPGVLSSKDYKDYSIKNEVIKSCYKLKGGK